MTIEDFIMQRLAEDEQIARSAIDPERPGAHWCWEDGARDPLQPGVVLRQCAALRSIMRTNVDAEFTDSGAALQIADAVAAIWSDHPDYQQEWAK